MSAQPRNKKEKSQWKGYFRSADVENGSFVVVEESASNSFANEAKPLWLKVIVQAGAFASAILEPPAPVRQIGPGLPAEEFHKFRKGELMSPGSEVSRFARW